MRIIHIVRQFFPSIGGLEDYVLSLALEQIKLGHSVSVLTLDSNFQTDQTLEPYEEVCGLAVHRVSWSFSKRYPIAWIKPKLLNEFDVVHVHAVDFLIDYISLLKKLRLVKSKVFLTTHGGFFHTPNQQALKKVFFNTITRFTLVGLDRVFTISSNDHNLFKHINKDCILVENGVRLQKFGEKLQRSNNSFDLIFLGRFSSNKKLEWLIEAFSGLKNNKGKLKIIGGSTTGDAKLLDDLIHRLEASDRVELLVDLNDEEILEHLSSSKFVVSASEYEGFGLSVIELMSYGLIPFLSDAPASFVDFIQNSNCGLTFNYDQRLFEFRYEQLVQEWSVEQSNKAINFTKQFSWERVAKDITCEYS